MASSNGRVKIAIFCLVTELLDSPEVVMMLPIDSSIVLAAVDSLIDS